MKFTYIYRGCCTDTIQNPDTKNTFVMKEQVYLDSSGYFDSINIRRQTSAPI